MSDVKISEIYLKTKEVVYEAGEIMLESLDEDSDIIQKSGESNFVTSIDLKVEGYLKVKLSEILPGSNIISEEADKNSFNLDRPTWILDPVDGTTNLIYNFGLSAISLALYIEGRPELSFIYNPFTKELFHAVKNEGAYLNDIRIYTSKREKLADALVIFGSNPYDRKEAPKTFKKLLDVFLQCREVRNIGSAALDIAYIACGRADAFFEYRLQPWDYAAGILILEEAGGKVVNWNGTNLDVLKPEGVIATNGKITNEFYELLWS
jgi:myo-inositol-1(or 4)-monophosphatase